jgi:hypothetical protein
MNPITVRRGSPHPTPPSSTPATPPPTRALLIECAGELATYTDADVRLGVIDRWGAYLESLAGSAPLHVQARRLRELAVVVVELVRRVDESIGASHEPI